MKIYLAIISLSLMVSNLTSASTVKFLETYEDTPRVNEWKIQKEDKQVMISGITYQEEITIITDQNYETKEWRLKHKTEETDIIATRDKNLIRVSGIKNGNPIEKNIQIDNKSWLQAPGLQLKPFIQSNEQKKKIWILTNATLKAHTMKFKKVNETDLVEVLMSPVGVGGLLWRANLWFDTQDGYFLKYAGPSGGVNSPKMITRRLNVKK